MAAGWCCWARQVARQAVTIAGGGGTGPTSSSSSLSLLQRTYIFTFLLSSRVFIPPHDLLGAEAAAGDRV